MSDENTPKEILFSKLLAKMAINRAIGIPISERQYYELYQLEKLGVGVAEGLTNTFSETDAQTANCYEYCQHALSWSRGKSRAWKRDTALMKILVAEYLSKKAAGKVFPEETLPARKKHSYYNPKNEIGKLFQEFNIDLTLRLMVNVD